MSKLEWFRRTTWTDDDREDFDARLKRSRSPRNKAQYLRIQAYHLSEVGNEDCSIELLDRLFVEFPEKGELAQAHHQKASSLARLGQIEAAVEEYRAALQAERDFPNVRTNAWLDFGWLVVQRQLANLYDEVARVLKEFRNGRGLKFPATEYRYATVQALLADAKGEAVKASEFAKQALAEAAKDHSGLRYHSALGLVGSERNIFEKRLKQLAGS
jgi:tetratricopeptide (TPR) repeat protein